MDLSGFDAKITALQPRRDATYEQMEETAKLFIRAATAWIVGQWDTTVRESIVGRPDVAKMVGTEVLSTIKRELEELKQRAAEIVATELDRDVLWAHRHESPARPTPGQPGYKPFGNAPSEVLGEPTRRLLGHPIGTLARHGFVEVGTERAMWERGSPPRFRYAIAWSPDMMTVAAEYSALLDRLVTVDADIAAIRRQKAEAEAQDLWDKA